MPAMADVIRTPQQLGNLIRRQRRKLGLTQAALGVRTGQRQSMISQIEQGYPSLRLDTLIDLLAALDLDLQAAPRDRSTVDDAIARMLLGGNDD